MQLRNDKKQKLALGHFDWHTQEPLRETVLVHAHRVNIRYQSTLRG